VRLWLQAPGSSSALGGLLSSSIDSMSSRQAQEERIGILHMAIALKGGAAHSAHYDVGAVGVGAAVGGEVDVGGGRVSMNGRTVTFPLSPPVEDGSAGRGAGVDGGGGLQGDGVGSEDEEDEGVYL